MCDVIKSRIGIVGNVKVIDIPSTAFGRKTF